MRALVVDDQRTVRDSLVALLKSFCPEIEDIVEADSVNSGIQKIELFNPDIIFLDVELKDGTGLDILSKTHHYAFSVIFITAHDKYALDAFRWSAVDYLLKPVQPAELIKAVQKIKNQQNIKMAEQLTVLYDMMKSAASQHRKIVLRNSDSIYFIELSKIVRCESFKSYTTFIVDQHKNIVVSKGLKEFEEMLVPMGFIRTHQSHLVNFSRISRFDKADGGMLIMDNNDVVPVSQRKREQLISVFKE